MPRIRFSIASLLIIVLWCAFALAALRAASAVWDQIAFSVTLACLLTTVLLAVHRTGQPRAFWLGFALFGGAYFLASQITSAQTRLITNRALVHAAGRLIPQETDLAIAMGWFADQNDPNVSASLAIAPNGNSQASGGWNSVRLYSPPLSAIVGGNASVASFVSTGHTLLAWLAGLVGGTLSRYLYSPRPPARVTTVLAESG